MDPTAPQKIIQSGNRKDEKAVLNMPLGRVFFIRKPPVARRISAIGKSARSEDNGNQLSVLQSLVPPWRCGSVRAGMLRSDLRAREELHGLINHCLLLNHF